MNTLQTDQKAVELAHALEDAFDFVQETGTLPDRARILESHIIKLLQTTSDCCHFLQDYVSQSFVGKYSKHFIVVIAYLLFIPGRMISLDASGRIDDMIESLKDQRDDLNSGLTLHNAVVAARMSETVDAQCMSSL